MYIDQRTRYCMRTRNYANVFDTGRLMIGPVISVSPRSSSSQFVRRWLFFGFLAAGGLYVFVEPGAAVRAWPQAFAIGGVGVGLDANGFSIRSVQVSRFQSQLAACVGAAENIDSELIDVDGLRRIGRADSSALSTSEESSKESARVPPSSESCERCM